MDKRIGYLDGLRGVLALIVFTHHFMFCFSSAYVIGGTSYWDATSPDFTPYKLVAFTPLNLFLNPGFAIGFFFLLSGYVLSYSYFKKPTVRLLQNNLCKRYFRLGIPVLASCILIWVLHKAHLFDKTGIPNTEFNKDWLAKLFPDNLSFLQTLKYGLYDSFTGNSDYNTVLWTISIELLGSFLVFIFLMISHEVENKLALFLGLLAIQFILADTNFKAFSFGMLLCYLQYTNVRYIKIISSPFIQVLLILFGLYLVSFPYVSYNGSLEKTMYRYTLFLQDKVNYRLAGIFGCSFLLIIFVNSNKLKTLFSAKPFIFLGKISFSLYLIHLCLIPVISVRIYTLLFPYLINSVNTLLTFGISLLCILSISYLFYKYVDSFAIKFASKMSSFILKYKN